jgi:hypothetical protein
VRDNRNRDWSSSRGRIQVFCGTKGGRICARTYVCNEKSFRTLEVQYRPIDGRIVSTNPTKQPKTMPRRLYVTCTQGSKIRPHGFGRISIHIQSMGFLEPPSIGYLWSYISGLDWIYIHPIQSVGVQERHIRVWISEDSRDGRIGALPAHGCRAAVLR